MKRPAPGCSLITGIILKIFIFWQIMAILQCYFIFAFLLQRLKLSLINHLYFYLNELSVHFCVWFPFKEFKIWMFFGLYITRLSLFDTETKIFFPSLLAFLFSWLTFIQPFTLYIVTPIDHCFYGSSEVLSSRDHTTKSPSSYYPYFIISLCNIYILSKFSLSISFTIKFVHGKVYLLF